MKRYAFILPFLMLTTYLLYGQETDSTQRIEWHVATGATVASGFGHTQSVAWVAPRITYRANERLTIHGGIAAAGSLLPEGYRLQGLYSRNLAPVRIGTQATLLWGAAESHPTERLWLWASVAHLHGYAQPLWMDRSLPLQATAFSGGLAYRFNEDHLLELHLSYVHDPYGTALGLMYHSYYDPLVPSFEIYPHPFGF